MNDDQNIFYTSISKFYSRIFPYNSLQLEFVKSRLGNLSGKRILDIGCATGELAFQLANEGALVTGIDLNANLLQQARETKRNEGLEFRQGDMLKLSNDFPANYFDGVLCFGNTLVHLDSLESVKTMLRGVRGVLKPGGRFLLQILNYDHIVENRVSELPLIDSEEIVFRRRYDFSNDLKSIDFITDLEIKSEGRLVSNNTRLLALRSGELKTALKEAGFVGVEMYSNFKMEPFGGKHLPLVAACSKS